MFRKRVTHLILLAGFGLAGPLTPSLAEETIPPGLVEVNATNKPKCVEYFNIKGKPYCSLKPLSRSDGGIGQYNYDALRLTFDGRPWVAAWGKKSPEGVMVEYVLKGDSIHAWRELVTSQWMPGLQRRLSPAQFSDSMIAQLKRQAPGVQTQYLLKSPQEVIFEFKISQPAEMAQHEIQRIFATENGLGVVHYVVKRPNMGEKTRNQWLALLKQAKPKE